MCTCITDLVCCTAESNTKLYTNYAAMNKKKTDSFCFTAERNIHTQNKS